MNVQSGKKKALNIMKLQATSAKVEKNGKGIKKEGNP